MMSEPKPLASLSSSLLARKGQAKPAMRPQGFAGFGMASAAAYEDLGWNDMGTEPAQISAAVVSIHGSGESAPAIPVVHRQQEDLAWGLAQAPVAPAPAPVASAPAPEKIKVVRAAPGSKAKAAFTLRLDPERHLQLRLVCAVQHRSAQQIVIAALDAFLATQSTDVALAKSKSAHPR